MSVPAIALYASPPGNICSGSNFSSHIAVHGSFDSDFSARSSSSSVIPKSIVGGRHASAASSFTRGDELGSVWHDKSEELSCSYLNPSYLNSVKIKSHSPVSVFQGPEMGSRSGTETAVTRKSPWESPSKERLFRGMVRESLGSSVEYDSSSSCVEGGAEIGLSEFNFYMEDVFVGSQSDCEPYAKEMLSEAQSRHKIFCEEFVMKAFYEAEKAHRGQMRASGDPYLRHCVETAILLANVGANATVVAAGLLHDTYDDSFVDHNYIFQRFGDDVADLVDGVTKLSQLSKLARENNTADKFAEAGRLHMMFLAMADARAVLIKLADRLHNMMTLGALPPIKQQRFAKETLEVFAPLANRLGISSWKEQLENLCFKHLNPEQHMELSSKLVKSFDEAMIASSKERLEKALNTKGISYHCLSGRHKSLYSIYSKMLKKKLNIDEVHDKHGLRLIVENESDCFKALNIVHGLWPKVDGRFKNYISHPKPNGYQSLHTVVLSEDGVPLEIQIRTKEMHLQAEYGFAAHWRYKEGDCKYSKFMLQKVEWARWVLTWQCESMSNGCLSFLGDVDSIRPPCPFPSHWKDCPHSYKPLSDHEGPIMVILLENDKMSVQEFPAHSTIMDLFERLGRRSPRWNNYSFPRKVELRPKLNHDAVAPQDRFKKLKMGDVVELTPVIPDKSLPGYREELRRMYDKGLAVSCRGPLRN